MPEAPDLPGGFGSAPTVAEVLAPHVRAQVAIIHRLDPVVRAGLPDAVHQMRVTARRLRSVLAAYRPEFDVEVTEPLRTELGWLIGCLGRARDLEVLRARVQSAAGADGQLASAVVTCVSQQQREAQEAAVAVMQTERYFRLLDALDLLADSPPWTERASRPAQAELVECLRRQWRRFRKAADLARHAADSAREQRLHGARRAAKRLRYAAEAAQPVLGSDLGGLGGALSEIQDVLGHHHDAVVAAQFVGGTELRSSEQVDREVHEVQRRLAREMTSDEKVFDHLYRRLHRSADGAMLR